MKTKENPSSGSSDASPLLPLKRFLVPIDFSPRSRLAVQYAGALAKRCGAGVELLFVVEPAPFYSGLEYSPLTIDDKQLSRTADKRLRKLAATLLPDGVNSAVAVRRGKAASEISAHAREQGADLILIPTHGYSGIERTLMGSTAEQVVRYAPCAVLTLRLEARAGGVRRGLAANGPQMRRILAPVDFSEPSRHALLRAAELAERFQAKLTVLHVAFSAPPPGRLAAFTRRLDARAIQEADGEIARLLLQTLRGQTDVSAEIVAGLPQDEIVRAAARLPADLIVIATHGRTGVKRWLMGSTAEQVIRHAPCPVLVLRQGDTRRRADTPAAYSRRPVRPRASSITSARSRSSKSARSALPPRNPTGWPRMKAGKFV